MKPTQAGRWVVGLTLASLAAKACGYRLIWPLDFLTPFAMIGFVGGAYSLRRSFGEPSYLWIFFWFAVFLLPNAKSDMANLPVGPGWNIPVVLTGWGSMLGLVWHFSKHLDLDDPDLRRRMFGNSKDDCKSLEAGI